MIRPVRNTTLLVFGACISAQASAWAGPNINMKNILPTQKAIHKVVGATAAASILAVSSMLPNPVNAASSDVFTGSYADPNHPSCARLVAVEGNTVLVSGDDGIPGPACIGGDGKPWKLVGSVDKNEIFVDFSPKVGNQKDY